MPEKLTACKKCKFGDCPKDVPTGLASCQSPRANSHFHSWHGKSTETGQAMCIQVNHDGHCEFWEAKT